MPFKKSVLYSILKVGISTPIFFIKTPICNYNADLNILIVIFERFTAKTEFLILKNDLQEK